MIIDSLENSKRIEGLNPYFKKVFDYVKSHDLLNAPCGRIVIDGDNAYINIDEPVCRAKEDALLETHDRYVDVQVLLNGKETFGWMARNLLMKERGRYNAPADISFYDDDARLYFDLSPGEFVIFFPEDGHAPCIGEGKIKKIVAKIGI